MIVSFGGFWVRFLFVLCRVFFKIGRNRVLEGVGNFACDEFGLEDIFYGRRWVIGIGVRVCVRIGIAVLRV